VKATVCSRSCRAQACFQTPSTTKKYASTRPHLFVEAPSNCPDSMDGKSPVDIDELAQAVPPDCRFIFAETATFGPDIQDFRKTTFQNPPKGALISEGAAAYRDAATARRTFDALSAATTECGNGSYGPLLIGEWSTETDSLHIRPGTCGPNGSRRTPGTPPRRSTPLRRYAGTAGRAPTRWPGTAPAGATGPRTRTSRARDRPPCRSGTSPRGARPRSGRRAGVRGGRHTRRGETAGPC